MPNFLRNLSLRDKIATLTSLLVVVVVLSLTLISIERERANFQQELVEQANLFLKTTTLSLRDSLYKLELDELIALTLVLREDKDISRFIVYDGEGRVLVDSDLENITDFSRAIDPQGQRLLAMPADETFMQWDDDQLLAGRSVRLGNQTIGAILTGLNTAELDEKISTITWQGIVLALAALVLGILLTILLSRELTHPLIALTYSAEQMANGNLEVRVQPASQDEIGRLAEAFNQMAVGLQEREWLRDMFGRFVSHEVADAIRHGRVKLEGEYRVVSVLFCDIRDFTNFSERHTPQEVVGMLNEFLPVVVQAAQKHGGMVNKFGGDSTLIIYGAPRNVEESAYRAIMTALEIRAGLTELNKRLTQKGEPALRVGTGINTGVALAGAVGPRERQEYTVVGHTVNLAARIDGLNKQFPTYDILVSGGTYEALGLRKDEFETRSLGQIPIRGQHDPVEVLAILDRRN
ncbi:MAG: adenylate/guanylate cyclase domain-containing protein [Anaerolineales bacterium]